MNKRGKVFIFLFAITIFIVGCQKSSNILNSNTLIDKDLNGVIEEDINRYKIDIKIDDNEKSFTGSQKTIFKNNTEEKLNEIYFRLYPNAFKTYENALIIFSYMDFNEEEYVEGYIDINKLNLNGQNADFTVEGNDETLLRIDLDKPLIEGEEIEIDMEYFVKLPTSPDRFGYSGKNINFGNWYPVLSVYDEDGWSKDPYYALGDPFYTDIGNYDVNITVNKDIIVASSGNILEEEIIDKVKTYKIEGRLIRDFAFVTSPHFKIKEELIDGTLIKMYYLKNNPSVIEKSLKYSTDSIKVFNEKFGKYPYGTYSVVFTEFSGGMEYPGIVFIGNDYFQKTALSTLESIIVHETAHQWWYGLVGNDEVKEAWLDEGIASYSEVIYMDKIYGSEKAQDYYIGNFEMGYEMIEDYLRGENNIVNKPLNEFSDWNDYGLLVYTKSAVFLEDIKNEYGMDMLLEILSTYFKEYKYKIATTRDFLRICEEVTGDSFDDMSEKWLN